MYKLAADLLYAMWVFYTELAFYLVLGFFFAGVLYVLFPEKTVKKHLGGRTISSVFKAALLGVPLPLCSCGVLPTAFSLKKQGASNEATTSFLISTPQTGIDSILVTYAFLGPVFAVIRPIAALISGIAGGFLVNRLDNGTPSPSSSVGSSNGVNRDQNLKERIRTMASYAFYKFPSEIARWLVIGIILAGLISYFLPDDFFTRYLDSEILTMLIFLVVGIPFYTCSTGSVPIAAALLMKGLSPGAAFVFLMAGPATSIASITLILKILGRRLAVIYIGTIVIFSLVFGFILNYLSKLFPQTASMMPHYHGSEAGLWNTGWAVLLSLILLNVFARQLLQQFRKTPEVTMSEQKPETVKCAHCREKDMGDRE